jgi:hypothetical protein
MSRPVTRRKMIQSTASLGRIVVVAGVPMIIDAVVPPPMGDPGGRC